MKQSERQIEKCLTWLRKDVFPLWNELGIDRNSGGFIENLKFDKTIPRMPRRAMVQSRQIYSFLTGLRLGVIGESDAKQAAEQGLDYLLRNFSLPSGAFAYSLPLDRGSKGRYPDLYTQAFALFGLAQVFSFTHAPEIKQRALKLLKYLHDERSHNNGFTELDASLQKSYKSNPHMHLFEAALSWMQVDPQEKLWQNLAEQLYQQCLNHFIDPETGLIAEYFNSDWLPIREEGRFIYEPGHQYEWAWLLFVHQELSGMDSKKVRHHLFCQAEKHGTSRARKVVYDEMWSDHTPKTVSSRFWPQGERIKAAARLGTEVSPEEQVYYAQAADEGLETLFKYLNTPNPGFWYDQLSESDEFSGDFSKSSSLYHIINAIEEYVLYRPRLEKPMSS